MDEAIRKVIDEREIEKLLGRYANMVDKRDWQWMDQIFAPEGTLDYTSSGGVAGAYRPTLEWLARALEPWPLNLHYVTNFDIEVDADRAMVGAPDTPLDEGPVHVFHGGRRSQHVVEPPSDVALPAAAALRINATLRHSAIRLPRYRVPSAQLVEVAPRPPSRDCRHPSKQRAPAIQ